MSAQSSKIVAFNKEIEVRKNPPKAIKFEVCHDGKSVQVQLAENTKENFRQFDPWTLACVCEAEKTLQIAIQTITFKVKRNASDSDKFNLYFEAFKRRVSFLQMNNIAIPLNFLILLDGKAIQLYTEKELFNRPANEIIRTDLLEDRNVNTSTNLEKAFQTFLYGDGIPLRTNARLAILGDHFLDVMKKDLPILREYPTGVFDKKVSDETRILMRDSVDFVSINKTGCLSVIELKSDINAPIELISQILDYALFFACYKDQLLKTANFKPFVAKIRKEEIACYVVANLFHQRIDSILPYYRTSGKYGFELYKVILGYTS